MWGVDFDQTIEYGWASLRFFEKNEHHISRFCRENVLLMVYEGVLRFSEDGQQVQVRAGEYYIQRKNRYQAGELASDAPKYLYVHFYGEWTDGHNVIPERGTFDYGTFAELIGAIDEAAHKKLSRNEKTYLFLKLLRKLIPKEGQRESEGGKMALFVEKNLASITSLSDICREFHYSKNYVIRIFKREFGKTPFQYINEMRIYRAMYLIEITSRSVKEISEECGFSDYSYFYRRFVEKTGTAPLVWRNRIRRDPGVKDKNFYIM